jgi:predicted DsbA family dithiol-disulfide isomerase
LIQHHRDQAGASTAQLRYSGNVRIDVWSDIVCPWCYVGKRRLEHALAELEDPDDVEVVHRSFQLNPAAPRDRTTDRAAGLKAKYGLSQLDLQAMEARLVGIAKDEGLDFHLDSQVSGNTFDAHRLVQMGRARGIQDAVVERLFRAYFTEQRSIFDGESLVPLAREAGLDEGEVRQVLAGDGYAEAVARDVAEAAALRVRGVPFFLLDGRLVLSGAQPLDVFRQALTQALATAPSRA